MIGGLDIYIRNSIMYNKTGSNEYLIVCGDDDKHQPVERNGTPVKEYHISLYRSLNPKNDLKALWQAVKIIRKEKPDVIHCHRAKGIIQFRGKNSILYKFFVLQRFPCSFMFQT